ncbi:hypothetical protein HKK72_36430, partial [Actinomadura sp. HBU206391]|nr:hypothetical protein [Actinomadura sp. HBU206391]
MDGTVAEAPVSTASPILTARGLVRQFRGFRAVDGVDLDVAEGGVHA